MKRALIDLAEAGCMRVYLGGSFVTAKDEPGDWDGCYEAAGISMLGLDKKIARADSASMKIVFFGEIYDADAVTRTTEPFRTFFQHNRVGTLVGLVALDPRTAR